jgi:hypothetical protein
MLYGAGFAPFFTRCKRAVQLNVRHARDEGFRSHDGGQSRSRKTRSGPASSGRGVGRANSSPAPCREGSAQWLNTRPTCRTTISSRKASGRPKGSPRPVSSNTPTTPGTSLRAYLTNRPTAALTAVSSCGGFPQAISLPVLLGSEHGSSSNIHPRQPGWPTVPSAIPLLIGQ